MASPPRLCLVPPAPVIPEVHALPCSVEINGAAADYVCISKQDTDKLVTYIIDQTEYVGLVLACKGIPTIKEEIPDVP